MKPKDVKNDKNRVYTDEHNKKVLDIMLAIELEYLSLKIYLLKDILLIGLEKYLLLIKQMIQYHIHIILKI